MARILLGWEIGENQGHVSRLVKIAKALQESGHAVALYLQRPEFSEKYGIESLADQAPQWRDLRQGKSVQLRSKSVGTMGDALAMAGLAETGPLATMIKGWDKIFLDFAPDHVVADYAPALLCAAKGRISSTQIGTGFTCPPSETRSFPELGNKKISFSETSLLSNTNHDLAACGRQKISFLPEIFESDCSFIGTYEELDPYFSYRENISYVEPSMASELPFKVGGHGRECFVYSYNIVKPESALWDALVAPGLPVRLHMRDASPEHLAKFEKLDIKYEPNPVSFREIAKRSCMVLSHGGHGFLCSSLLSGLPQLSLPFDVEKFLNSEAIERIGIGYCLPIKKLNVAVVAEAIDDIWKNRDMQSRCMETAKNFRKRRLKPMSEAVVNHISWEIGHGLGG